MMGSTAFSILLVVLALLGQFSGTSAQLQPTIGFSQALYRVSESENSVRLCVDFTVLEDQMITATITTVQSRAATAGEDYRTSTRDVEYSNTGDTAITDTECYGVRLFPDRMHETNEKFTVEIQNVAGETIPQTSGEKAATIIVTEGILIATVTIEDDDPRMPLGPVNPGPGQTGSAGNTTAAFLVVMVTALVTLLNM